MKLLLFGALTGLARFAHAGDDDAPEPPRPPPPPAALGQGVAWSADGGVGVSASSASIAPVISETGSLGFYVASSDDRAMALEAVENINLVIDRTTPQYGFLAIGLRRLARSERPWIGAPGRSVGFQRLAVGPALLGDGNRFATGLAADVTLGYLTHGASGFAVDVGAYAFDASDLGKNTLVLLGVSYMHSPLVDVPHRAAHPWQPVPTAPAPAQADITQGPCRAPAEYHASLREHRKRLVEACAAQAPDCEAERAAVSALDAKLKACTTQENDDAQP